MGDPIFDYETGSYIYSVSDNVAMDSDGNLLMRMGDNMAMDTNSGEIHLISDWLDDD